MNVSDEQVTAAVLAVLNAGGPSASASGYELDALKKLPKLPNEYTEVYVTRRFGGEMRSDSFTGTDAYRISLRQVSLKNTYNAREFRRRARVNLEYAAISANGFTSTPVLFEASDDIAEDDQGYYSGLETYTLTF